MPDIQHVDRVQSTNSLCMVGHILGMINPLLVTSADWLWDDGCWDASYTWHCQYSQAQVYSAQQ